MNIDYKSITEKEFVNIVNNYKYYFDNDFNQNDRTSFLETPATLRIKFIIGTYVLCTSFIYNTPNYIYGDLYEKKIKKK